MFNAHLAPTLVKIQASVGFGFMQVMQQAALRGWLLHWLVGTGVIRRSGMDRTRAITDAVNKLVELM